MNAMATPIGRGTRDLARSSGRSRDGVPGGAHVRIREALRLWLAGEGYRAIARLARVDRKTVRRYVEAAQAAGVVRDRGEDQPSDAVIAVVRDAVRPARVGGHGAAWDALVPNEELIRGWVEHGVRLTKIADLRAAGSTSPGS